jgi:hypothetical protein
MRFSFSTKSGIACRTDTESEGEDGKQRSNVSGSEIGRVLGKSNDEVETNGMYTA